MTKFNYIPYLDKRTNKPCMLEDNPNELTKTFKYEDGSEKIVSIATFKRWYKKVEDEPFVFVDKTEPEVSITVPVDFTKEPTNPDNLSAIKTAVKELTSKLKEEKEKNAEGTDAGQKEKKEKTPTKKAVSKRSSKKDADKVVDKDALTAEMFADIEKLVTNRLPAEFKAMSVAKKRELILTKSGKRIVEFWARFNKEEIGGHGIEVYMKKQTYDALGIEAPALVISDKFNMPYHWKMPVADIEGFVTSIVNSELVK